MGGAVNNLRVIFLLPTALVVIALYQDLFGAAQFLAQFLREWSAFWSQVWTEAFILLKPLGVRFPHQSHDMLTLMVTLLAVIGLWPLLLTPLGIRPYSQTVRDAVTGAFPREPAWLIAMLTMCIVLTALIIVLFPFSRSQGPHVTQGLEASLGVLVSSWQTQDYGMLAASMAALFGTVGLAVWVLIQSVTNVLNPEEGEGGFPTDAVLWALGLAIYAIIAHSYFGLHPFSVVLLLVIGVLQLLRGISYTSALSLVQIASIVGGVLLLDAVISAAGSAWSRVS